ncbi:MAG: class I SAM-dependent methyltransferase [Nitriliruptorales bacterium]|nr:class I SAM-dependent methyltransferase [Nitriliruptorales bacterium]
MPLLLHSLAEFQDLILPALEAVRPRAIVEVGSETGANAKVLVDWAGVHGAVLHSVDPEPADDLVKLAAVTEHLHVVAEYSPEALPGIGPADAYLLDGDHNHSTVTRELDTIDEVCDRFPLVILHDVGWPCGRRDQYYAPDRLPADRVHPHSWDEGVTPDNPGTVRGGFRGEGAFAAARHEGGPANGVLTAVEDFRERRPGLAYHQVPSVFGLGILYPEDAHFAGAVRDLFDPYDRHPLLERLERNRLELYLRVIALQDEMAGRVGQQDRMVAGYEAALAALNVENTDLRLRLAGGHAGRTG